jgi:NitT/TauT family transport system substrate-binding protein
MFPRLLPHASLSLRRWLGALGLGLLSLQVHAKDFTVATNTWPGYEPLYVAKELDEHNVLEDISILRYANASDVITAFESGIADAAALTLDEALLLVERGYNLGVVLVMDISAGGDAIVSTRPQEPIKGQTIVLEKTALGAFFVARFLQHHNLGTHEVALIDAPVDAHIGFLQNDTASIFATFEPYRTHLIAGGAKEIFNSNAIPTEIIDVLVINRDRMTAEKNEQLEHLIKAWFKTLQTIQRDPELTHPILARNLELQVDEIAAAYTGLELPNLNKNQDLLETEIVATARKVRDILLSEGILLQSVDVIHLPEKRYLP